MMEDGKMMMGEGEGEDGEWGRMMMRDGKGSDEEWRGPNQREQS